MEKEHKKLAQTLCREKACKIQNCLQGMYKAYKIITSHPLTTAFNGSHVIAIPTIGKHSWISCMYVCSHLQLVTIKTASVKLKSKPSRSAALS